jgi:hypothetical protein
MASASKSVQISLQRPFRIKLPKFIPSPMLRYLDAAKLAKGAHTIEVGRFDGCECDCAVTAKVRNGMVTGVAYTKCKSARQVSAATAKALRDAHRKLTRGRKRRWTDFPVRDLVGGTAVGRMTDIIVTDGCFMVCWDEGRGEECVICCFEERRHWCIGPSEPALSMG